MRKRNTSEAFTLAEILVGITIITILALGVSSINFSRLSQKQQVEIEVVQIINIFEEARNNALIGRGVGVGLETPDSWNIIVENTTSSGSLIMNYLNGSLTQYTNWDSPVPFSINNLECRTLDDISDTSSGPFTITFTGSTGGISGCSDDTYKKINFDYGIGDVTQNITINTLSGIIEAD